MNAVTVDQLIVHGELSAQQIADKLGVAVAHVRLRALQLDAPFSRRRPREVILADLAQQLEQMHNRFHVMVRAAYRQEPMRILP